MFIGRIYMLILPAMLGGILNMVFVKVKIFNFLKKPMDNGCILKDGKRLFGDNKTWKGFLGMIVLTGLSALLVWGNMFSYPFLCGAWLGLGYILFELPNSFIKRRLGVQAGKNGGARYTFFDQIDSVIGCILFMFLFYKLTWQEVVGILIIATATHYIINILLFYVKLRNQRG